MATKAVPIELVELERRILDNKKILRKYCSFYVYKPSHEKPVTPKDSIKLRS